MIQRIRSGSPYEDTIGFSRAVRIGDRILMSGTAPIPAPGTPLAADAGGQMRRCGEIISDTLARAGADLSHVVRTRMFIVDPADAGVIGAVHAELFGAVRPAATMVVVAALLVIIARLLPKSQPGSSSAD